MTPGIDDQKKSLLDQVISILESRYSVRRARLAALYVKYYFRRVPLDDIAREAALRFSLERGGRSGRIARQFANEWIGRARLGETPRAE